LDSVQYTRRDWRNRNRIKTPQGPTWLTIPVEVKGRYFQAIDETRVADSGWAERHIRAIESAYTRAPHYETVAPWLFDLVRSVAASPLLTTINHRLLRSLCDHLCIMTPIRHCSEIIDRELLRTMDSTRRLLEIVKSVGGTRYLSGPAARNYLDVGLFAASGIEVVWMEYEGYPEYPQLWGAFEPRLSIIDVLLNTGAEAPRYLARTVT
jgi:hypothetical protein